MLAGRACPVLENQVA
ncbi:hypothetical protein A2U01_0097218, partial [Trifolium medium]|nr:hypothetical protein [Trifolium medium]